MHAKYVVVPFAEGFGRQRNLLQKKLSVGKRNWIFCLISNEPIHQCITKGGFYLYRAVPLLGKARSSMTWRGQKNLSTNILKVNSRLTCENSRHTDALLRQRMLRGNAPVQIITKLFVPSGTNKHFKHGKISDEKEASSEI